MNATSNAGIAVSTAIKAGAGVEGDGALTSNHAEAIVSA